MENRTNVHMIPVSDLHGHSAPPPMAISHADSSSFEHFDFGHDGSALGAQEWPSEILDSMAWSAQFFDAVQGTPPAPFDNPS